MARRRKARGLRGSAAEHEQSQRMSWAALANDAQGGLIAVKQGDCATALLRLESANRTYGQGVQHGAYAWRSKRKPDRSTGENRKAAVTDFNALQREFRAKCLITR